MRTTTKNKTLLKNRAAFTMIEFAFSLGLATLSIAAIIATNSVQNLLARNQQNQVIVTWLAQSFFAQLVGESVNWNADFDFDSTETPLLLYGLGGTAEGVGQTWYAVPNSAETGSPYFNSLGVPSETMAGDASLNPANGLVNTYAQRYCIHYRLDYIVDELAPWDVLNVQVRIIYARSDVAFGPEGVQDCGFSDPDAMFNDTENFRSYGLTSTISQLTAI